MSGLVERRKDLVAAMMKDGIYEAAVQVLMNHGVDGLTMDRVAETAGVAKGSLYNYFRSKKELVEFIHAKIIEPAKTFLVEMHESPMPAAEKLGAIVRMWLEYFSENRGVCDLLFNDARMQEMLDESKRTGRLEAIEDLTVIFEQGIKEGDFREMDTARTAELFLGSVIITLEHQALLNEVRPIDESVNLLLDVFVKGLEPRN